MKERKFKIGDKITYKSNHLCNWQYSDEHGEYYWGGDNQEGYVGTITNYNSYIESKDCYKIEVTAKDRDTYTMLECEFKEYDHKPEYKSLVGRWVKFLRTLNDTKAGTCLLITEDYESDDCMEVKGYGAFDRIRLTNGDCELMPKGWEVNMYHIQQECMKRFPIGCDYKCAMNHNRGKLEMDDYTYRIVDDSIYAHAGSGCLYKNGKYATIQLPISSTTSIGTYTGSTESMRITSSGTFLGSPCAEIHIPSRITHQEPIITKRVKKSNKLIIK